MQSFDKIYILNLHGNARKKELAADGSKDENVFDIMTGVSINIFIKTGLKKKGTLAEVYYYDLMGLRDIKYDFLRQHPFVNMEYSKVDVVPSLYFFIPQDTEGEAEYKEGFSVDELMHINVTGVVSARDGLVIDQNRNELLRRIQLFANLDLSDDEIRRTFFGRKKEGKYLPGDSRGWKLTDARRKIQNNNHSDIIKKYEYRPLDFQYIYYTPDMVDWGREKFMCHFLRGSNLGVVCKKGFPNNTPPIFVSDSISDFRYWSCSGMQGGDYIFPLYLYPEEGSFDTERRPNLDEKIWAAINAAIGHETSPEDIFDYIYGVLHSPSYRAKYKEFLKVDFPRIPYPKNAEEFEHFRACGNALRELHLMHNVPDSPVRFEQQGSMMVDYLRWDWNKDDGYSGCVWINDEQCFENVPAEAWDFFIGGYQPAQKWLKDRKGRKLEYDDVKHYCKIIAVLMETARIMKTIDNPTVQVEELKKKVQDLEHQLHEKAVQGAAVVNFIGGNVTYNDNSNNYTIKK